VDGRDKPGHDGGWAIANDGWYELDDALNNIGIPGFALRIALE
jgi:hypothetical protein